MRRRRRAEFFGGVEGVLESIPIVGLCGWGRKGIGGWILPRARIFPSMRGSSLCLEQVGGKHRAIPVIVPIDVVVEGVHGAVAVVFILFECVRCEHHVVALALRREGVGGRLRAKVVGLERMRRHHGVVACVGGGSRRRCAERVWRTRRTGRGS
jgi:hypothetical protein